MAEFKGTNVTTIDAGTDKVDASQVGTKVRCFVEQIDLATNDVDTADTIIVAKLPANSRFLKIDVIANGSTNASSAAATAGDGTDADRFAASTSLPAAGKTVTLDNPTAGFVGSEVTAETNVVLTIASADLPNASGDALTFVTWYADLN